MFDDDAARRAELFFSGLLRHVKGEWAGRPFTLEPWQRDLVIRPLFGTLRDDGSRQYRRAYVEIPRKNGKSTLSAGIALKLLCADREPGAEVYSAAADRDQARIVFETAKEIVMNSPQLSALCKPYKYSIVVPKTGSSYKVLSAEAYSKHGLNAHGIIFDELHAQPNRELWDVLTTSTGARRQPLVVAITTAGHDHNSICYEQHEYALKVLAGIIEDPTFLAVIFAAGPDDDWRDPRVWAKANPSLGATIKAEYIEAECKRAIEVPGYQNTFRRLHLNQWTEQDVRWLPMDAWDECGEAFDPADLEGQECFGGLDLALTKDLSALELAFPQDDGTVKVLSYFWVPEENARQRGDRDRVPYPLWIQQGLITATPGNITDFDRIREDIRELGERFNIREIAYDRWRATQLVTQLTGDGFTMVPLGQGFASLTAPSRELEKLVIGKRLRHGGNPVLRWMASNVAAETDAAGNIKPSKKRSTERIDGIVALIMALSRMIVQPEVPESVYMHRGIDFIGAPEPRARQAAAPEPESPEEAAQQQKLAEFQRLQMMRRRGLI